MPRLRFLNAVCVVGIALVLQLNSVRFFGGVTDFVLAALIALASFLEFVEMLALVLISAVVLFWRPGVSMELLTLIVTPLFIWFFNRYFPMSTWLNNLVLIILGIFFFYLAVDYAVLFRNFPDFLRDVALAAFFGGVIFEAFDYFYQHNRVGILSNIRP